MRFLRLCAILALAVSVSLASVAQAADEAGAEAGHAAESAGEHGAASTNPISLDPDLAIFTLIIFLVVLGILWKFAWGPISEALDQREKAIADNIQAAVDKHDEAKLMLAQYEKRLASAADEVRELLEEARRDAEHTKTEIIAEAKAAAQAEHDRSMREVRGATDAALKELAETSATLAVDLAGKIVREKLTAEDQSRLVRDMLAKLPNTQPSKN
ncbi:MAG: F0F1 ATP synthase subunit B [Pirellulales bacterium]